MPPTEVDHAQPYQSHSHFMGLPLDLILKIFDGLRTAHDSISLSLICKGLYEHLFSRARAHFQRADRYGKRDVQMMLEQALSPDQTYCAFCSTFHTVDEEYCRTSCLGNQHPAISSLHRELAGGGTWKLNYLDARLALNAVLLERPGADKLVESLEWTVLTETDKATWFHWQKAKVIRGELFLKITSWHVRRPWLGADKPFEKFTYSVCKHVHIRADHPTIHADFKRVGGRGLIGIDTCVSSTCDLCQADWNLVIEWDTKPEPGAARRGLVIKITTWQRIGDLRSPYCYRWSRCAKDSESLEEIDTGYEGYGERWRSVFDDEVGECWIGHFHPWSSYRDPSPLSFRRRTQMAWDKG